MILTTHQSILSGDKPRIIRWMLHISGRGVRKDAYRFWWGNLKNRDHLEYLGMYRKIIFNLKEISLDGI
jgi:hypothetical protein